MKVRSDLQENLFAARAGILKAAKQKPAFIALPEYFSVPNNMENFTSARDISKETYKPTLNFLSEIGKEVPEPYIMGGTMLEEDNGNFYNSSTLWRGGKLIGKYRKVCLPHGEVRRAVYRRLRNPSKRVSASRRDRCGALS